MHPKNIFGKVSFFRTNTPNLRVHFRPRSRVPNLFAEFRNAKYYSRTSATPSLLSKAGLLDGCTSGEREQHLPSLAKQGYWMLVLQESQYALFGYATPVDFFSWYLVLCRHLAMRSHLVLRRVSLSAGMMSSFRIKQKLQRLVVRLYDLAVHLMFYDKSCSWPWVLERPNVALQLSGAMVFVVPH